MSRRNAKGGASAPPAADAETSEVERDVAGSSEPAASNDDAAGVDEPQPSPLPLEEPGPVDAEIALAEPKIHESSPPPLEEPGPPSSVSAPPAASVGTVRCRVVHGSLQLDGVLYPTGSVGDFPVGLAAKHPTTLAPVE